MIEHDVDRRRLGRIDEMAAGQNKAGAAEAAPAETVSGYQ
jgi:hypothetical protein